METPPRGSTATRIVLADDHRMFREALRTTIDSQADMAVIGEAGHGLEAVALTRQLSPDVLLLDLAMPGMDGLEALRQIASSASTTRVILLTAGIDKTGIAAALRLGARGLILKESGSAQLLKGIRGVRDGQYWVGREAVADLVEVIRHTTLPKAPATRDFGLTTRELQVVAAVVAACGNREIATKLSISQKTVKHHLTNIFDKLGVSNRLELALFAVHHGLGAQADIE
jgi:DNA-binding NarL/FixJ family response regulator